MTMILNKSWSLNIMLLYASSLLLAVFLFTLPINFCGSRMMVFNILNAMVTNILGVNNSVVLVYLPKVSREPIYKV